MMMKNAISAGHSSTLQVARDILAVGGNAFDAAVAAHFAMFITEPCMASAGGNGFALSRPQDGQIYYLDFFSQTPASKNIESCDFFPIVVDFGNETEEFHIGLGAAAVPGSIAGIIEIHDRWGSIPLKELIQPACDLATGGVILNNFQAYDILLLENIFKQDKRGLEIFFNEKGIKVEGDMIAMPHVTDFLDFIAREGKRGFYEGEIAQSIVRDSIDRGGFLRMSDFENYYVNKVSPLSFSYRNRKVYVPNGPNNGGINLALFLGLLQRDKLTVPECIKATQQIVLDSSSITKQMDTLHPGHNYTLSSGPKSYQGTSHFNILDKKGNAISLTSSIGEGCGYFIPGTDMQLNNMLGELFLLPNGKHSWASNSRMQSMMTPTIITDQKGKVEFIAGSGGASRIPFAIGQVIDQLYNNGLSLEDAVESPRYHFQNEKFQVEKGADWKGSKEDAVLWDIKSLYFGGVHAIYNNMNLEAAGDGRRYGVAEIF